MKYKAVIFDLDGTILNTSEDLADSVNYALRENGLPQRTLREVRSFVGNGIRKLIERSCGADADEKTVEKVLSVYTDYYQQHCADKTRPYDGITGVIEKLRENGVKTAVLSNKQDIAVQALADKYFHGLFDFVSGERPGIPRKPSPGGVLAAAEVLGADKSDCVYIGDSEVDITTAVNTGMDMITVSWGFRDRSFLIEHGATVTVSTADELTAELL